MSLKEHCQNHDGQPMRTIRAILSCAVALLSFAAAVPGQRPERTSDAFYEASVGGIEYGGIGRCYLTGASDPTPGVVVFECRAPDFGVWYREQLTITRVGSAVHVGGLQFLVSGQLDVGGIPTGRLQLIEFRPLDADPLVVVTSVDMPGWDPIAIGYNDLDAAICVWDVAGAAVKVASWQAGSASLPQVGAFQVAVPEQSLAPFSVSDYWVQFDIKDNVSGALLYQLATLTGRTQELKKTPLGTWELLDYKPVTASVPSWAVRGSSSFGEPWHQSLEVLVSGPVPDTYTIKDVESGQTVFSGLIATANQWASVSPPAEFGLTPGRLYTVQGASSSTQASAAFSPLVRYGNPLSSSNIAAGRGVMAPSRAFLPNSKFAVGARFSQPPAASYSNTFAVTVAVALRNLDGSDPVSPHPTEPGVWLLSPLGIVEYTHSQPDRNARTTGARIPLPDLPFLEGFVVLYQFYYGDPNGTEIAVSDVFGTTLLATPTMAASASGGGSQALMQAGALSAAQVVHKSLLAREKFREDPLLRITPSKQQRFDVVLGKIRQH